MKDPAVLFYTALYYIKNLFINKIELYLYYVVIQLA